MKSKLVIVVRGLLTKLLNVRVGKGTSIEAVATPFVSISFQQLYDYIDATAH